MTELPQATSRREIREREEAAKASAGRSGRAARPAKSAKRAGRSTTTNRHGVASKLLSFAAMVFAGALAIGTSVPANAFYPISSAVSATSGTVSAGAETTTGSVTDASTQAATVGDGQSVDAGPRDQFRVLSWAEVLAQKYAQVHNYTFVGGKGSIRWPFPYQVSISSPYGPRIAPCSGCSTFHNGADFTPGEGAAIFAVADGVVTGHEDGTSEYGNFVIITHKIAGETVTSTYAHMLGGSSADTVGQTVRVGDFLGLVGMTGEATGPHLHFEIAVNSVRVDPIVWLETHVN